MPLYRRPGSPYWWVKIGRHTRRSTGTEDRTQAEEFERTLTERLWRQRKLGDKGALSWREAVERYLNGSRRERKRDRELLEWLSSDLNEHAVSAVADPDALEELRKDGLAEGWSHSTIDRMMRTVRAVLRDCWKRKVLDAPPYVPMYGEPPSKPRFLTPDQFRGLCDQLPENLQLGARFAVTTLLRHTSQARLTWDRIDRGHRTAWIPPDDMKGGASVWPDGFTCQLSPEALAILDEAKKSLPRSKTCFGQAAFFTAAFRKAAERAGLDGLRWHDLRHTGASWAVQGGVSLPQLMDLGGWKSYRMVLRYARFAKQDTAVAATVVGSKVAQALGKKKRREVRRKPGK